MSIRRVEFPLFEIASNPKVNLTDIKEPSRICPVCQMPVRGLLRHAESHRDKEHQILAVMIS